MITGIAIISKKVGMSDEEFHRYWREVHAPQIPLDAGIVRYAQCHQAPET